MSSSQHSTSFFVVWHEQNHTLFRQSGNAAAVAGSDSASQKCIWAYPYVVVGIEFRCHFRWLRARLRVLLERCAHPTIETGQKKKNDLSLLSASVFLLLLALVSPDNIDSVHLTKLAISWKVLVGLVEWKIYDSYFVKVSYSSRSRARCVRIRTRPNRNTIDSVQNLSSWTPFTQRIVVERTQITICKFSPTVSSTTNDQFQLGKFHKNTCECREIRFDEMEMWYWLLTTGGRNVRFKTKWNWNWMVPMSNKKYETIFLYCLIWHIFNAHIHGWKEANGKM